MKKVLVVVGIIISAVIISGIIVGLGKNCLLYTSDAADE